MSTSQPPSSDDSIGPIDGSRAGDHDQPYEFGQRPRADAPYPFTTRQYARLLVLRSRLGDSAELLVRGRNDEWLPPAA
jgi:hypothetical protein